MNRPLIERPENISYVSLDRIAERVHDDYPFIEDIPTKKMMEWVGILYGKLKAADMFKPKITGEDALTPDIVITGYRGELPCDYHSSIPGCVVRKSDNMVYRESLKRSLFEHNRRDESPTWGNTDLVYKIQGGYIFTEDEETELIMAYNAYPIDGRGYPMLPDIEDVIEFAVVFIAQKISFGLVAEEQIPMGIYSRIEQDLYWKQGVAAASLKMPSVDRLESWTWATTRLLPRIDHHAFSFGQSGTREDLSIGT